MTEPGDYGVRATHGFFGPHIRRRIHSHVDHAVIYLGGGIIAETTPTTGHAHIRHLHPGEADKYQWSRFPLTPDQRRAICDTLTIWAAQRRPWSTMLALAAWADTSNHPRLRWTLLALARRDGATCGTITAHAYRQAGYDPTPGIPTRLVTAGTLHDALDGR